MKYEFWGPTDGQHDKNIFEDTGQSLIDRTGWVYAPFTAVLASTSTVFLWTPAFAYPLTMPNRSDLLGSNETHNDLVKSGGSLADLTAADFDLSAVASQEYG